MKKNEEKKIRFSVLHVFGDSNKDQIKTKTKNKRIVYVYAFDVFVVCTASCAKVYC